MVSDHEKRVQDLHRVLILVVMEYGLRPRHGLYLMLGVLILVVMEYGLRLKKLLVNGGIAKS